MTNMHSGFLRHFISGFAIGAVALVAVQFTGGDETKIVHAAPPSIERVG